MIRSILTGVITNKMNKNSPQHLKRRGEQELLVPKTDQDSVDSVSIDSERDQDIYNTSGELNEK